MSSLPTLLLVDDEPHALSAMRMALEDDFDCLTAEDASGCDVTDSIFILVEPVYEVFIPNAFSPNFDGVNDNFTVFAKTSRIQRIRSVEIFNRWGQEVYRSFDPMGSWDGTFDGDDLEPDVFGFHLSYVCPGTEQRVTQQGNITILR